MVKAFKLVVCAVLSISHPFPEHCLLGSSYGQTNRLSTKQARSGIYLLVLVKRNKGECSEPE